MFKKISIIFIIPFLAAAITGCGERIDFYASTPSLFDDEPQQDTKSNQESSKAEKKKDSLFDYEDTESKADTDSVPDTDKNENIPKGTVSPSSAPEPAKVLPDSGLCRDILPDDDKNSYDKIYNGAMSGNLVINFDKGYTMDEIKYIYRCVKQDHPEIFWLDSSYSVSEGESSSSMFLNFINDVNADNLDEYRRNFNEKISSVISLVPQDISLYEQIVFLHDYLVENTEYATDYILLDYEDSQMYYNAYGCLVQNRSVCSGYSAAFKCLMDEIGVKCGNITGFATRNAQGHSWNYVQYEGEYYWVDVTWDDPVSLSDTESESESSGTGDISHKYFFITSEELLRDHTIVDGENAFVPECTATEYNYMKYYGNFMENYSFEEFDRLVSERDGNVAIQFGSKEAFVDALTDLIYNKNIYSTEYFLNNNLYGFSYISDMETYTLEIISRQR